MYKGTKNREDSLRKGTLFDDYYIRLDNKKTGRRKQIIETTSEGWYSTHWCYHCYYSKHVSPKLLRIAHFKSNCAFNAHTEITHTLSMYTKELQKNLKSICSYTSK